MLNIHRQTDAAYAHRRGTGARNTSDTDHPFRTSPFPTHILTILQGIREGEVDGLNTPSAAWRTDSLREHSGAFDGYEFRF